MILKRVINKLIGGISRQRNNDQPTSAVILKSKYYGPNAECMHQWLTLGGEQFTNLEFRGISKVGNLSWSGRYRDIKVKIYQTFSPEQANFIQQVSELDGLTAFFPKVIFRKEEYIVAEWVAGKTIEELNWISNSKWIDQIVSLQSNFHRYHFANDPSTFEYSTFLTDRLLKYLGPLDLTHALQIMLDIVKTPPVDSSVHLCHFDMTPSNFVVDFLSGRLKLIDNELLTQCSYYPFDFFNTHRALQKSKTMQLYYTKSYLELCDNLDFVLENKRYFQAIWGLRVVGTMFQSGEFNKGLAMANEFLDFEHPLFTALEKGN